MKKCHIPTCKKKLKGDYFKAWSNLFNKDLYFCSPGCVTEHFAEYVLKDLE